MASDAAINNLTHAIKDNTSAIRASMHKGSTPEQARRQQSAFEAYQSGADQGISVGKRLTLRLNNQEEADRAVRLLQSAGLGTEFVTG